MGSTRDTDLSWFMYWGTIHLAIERSLISRVLGYEGVDVDAMDVLMHMRSMSLSRPPTPPYIVPGVGLQMSYNRYARYVSSLLQVNLYMEPVVSTFTWSCDLVDIENTCWLKLVKYLVRAGPWIVLAQHSSCTWILYGWWYTTSSHI